MTPQSIYRLRTDSDGQQASQYIPRRSLRSLGGYNYVPKYNMLKAAC